MKKLVFILLSVLTTAGFVIFSNACEPYIPPNPVDTLKILESELLPPTGWSQPVSRICFIYYATATGRIQTVVLNYHQYNQPIEVANQYVYVDQEGRDSIFFDFTDALTKWIYVDIKDSTGKIIWVSDTVFYGTIE